MNKRRSLLITILFSIFFTFLTGTLSYLIWQTGVGKRTNISFKVPNMCAVSIDGGGDILAGSVNMYPAACTDTTATVVKEINLEVEYQEDASDVLVELWLNVNELDLALSNSKNFRYSLSRSNTNCYDDVIATGNFNGLEAGSRIKIFEETYMGVYPDTKKEKFYLYIWLDEAETDLATAGANFYLSLGGTCDSVMLSTGNVMAKPVVDDGMIPVTVANDGTVTTISEDDSSWYNYDEKKWANVVLVKNDAQHNEIYNLSSNANKVGAASIDGATFANNGLSFDGSNDYVNIPLSISGLNSFTIEAEFTADSISSSLSTAIFENFESGGIGIQITASKQIRFGVYDNGISGYSFVTASDTVEIGKKYLVTGVYTGNQIVLYINGVLIGTTTVSGTIKNAAVDNSFMLGCALGLSGCSSSDSAFFDGIMHSARFYNRALSSSEVENNYDGKVNYTTNDLLVSYQFKDGRRLLYTNNSGGINVPTSEILAYYVWIPRYKYKIWDVTGTSSPQTIDIEFESSSATPVLGTAVGEWRTHPAFIWDGSPVSGIWVGKFETTGDDTTPTILPNTLSLTEQDLSTQFATSLKFAGGTLSDSAVTFTGNNTYGLTANTDSHLLKNSEWGAVAYLSHSLYGINDEIRINNYWNNGTKTGCGASESNAASTTECQIAYGGASSYPQSTTGNITGVFDMSGGASEYVMGHYDDTIDVFNDWSGFTTLPMSKHYDLYTKSEALGACDGDICYGHALSETTGWYNDYQNFVSADGSWLLRGGCYQDGSSAGVWYFINSYGDSWNGYSFRSVIIPLKLAVDNDFETLTANISSTNNMSDSQTVSLDWDENGDVVSYSWGITHPYKTTDWNDVSTNSISETVTEPGTYYLGLKTSSGSITVVKKNFYETKLVVRNGSVGYDRYITMEGNSITLSEATVDSGYMFLGWYTKENGGGNELVGTYTPTYSSTIYANIKSNVLIVNYYTDGGILTSSTSDESNTYNWTQEVNGLVKVNDVVLESIFDYDHDVKLLKFNDSNYMNISKEYYDGVVGEEWICFDGCSESDKTFNQNETYTVDDFCDASNGNCIVSLKVNWYMAATVVNAIRYKVGTYNSVKRLGVYYITKCQGGMCDFTSKYGFTGAFTGVDYFGDTTGVGQVAESELTSNYWAGEVDAYYTNGYNDCYVSASKTTKAYDFPSGCTLRNFFLTGHRSSTADDVGTRWYYYPDQNCYVLRNNLYSRNDCSS